jgi:ACR3 family arsenite efflux pump ArsB
MVYLRGGTVVEQPSFVDSVLALPIRLYHFFMFFIMTLIDVTACWLRASRHNSRCRSRLPCCCKYAHRLTCLSR